VLGAGWCARRLTASYFLGRGERALYAGDARRALADLDRAARATPGEFAPRLAAATAASRAGDPAAARARAEEALTIEPFSPNAWEALARARLDGGDAAGAVAAADRALDLLHAYPAARATRAAAALR
jgi:predicted Zn-dependent protease